MSEPAPSPPSTELRRCCLCKRELPLDAFLTITVRDKRCKPGHSWTGPSYDCRECRKQVRREQRRRKAEAEGRPFIPVGDRAAFEASRRAARAERKATRVAVRDVIRAIRAQPEQQELRRRDAAEKKVRYQRERYNADPTYQAKIKAKKIRRKRAQNGTKVEPVNREVVAQRDGWCCGICGGKVTRDTWSLDHVIPLSKGGTHTYDNVVLAHRSCNSRRGAGRLPVQAPLFATL